MRTKEIKILVQEFEGLKDLSAGYQNLVKKARDVAQNAYAPYSGFYVGAAVLLENGKIITGNNQENSAFPSGLCAERVALFYANAKYPDSSVKTIAVTAMNSSGLVPEPVGPCGSCRQVLVETEFRFKGPINIILDSRDKILVLNGVESLLPFRFKPESLK